MGQRRRKSCVSPENLSHSELWWNGPKWLRTDECNWPKPIPLSLNFENEVKSELKIVMHVTVSKELTRNPWFKFASNKNTTTQLSTPLLKTFSSFNKLTQVTAFLFRAVYNFKNNKNGKSRTGPLTTRVSRGNNVPHKIGPRGNLRRTP